MMAMKMTTIKTKLVGAKAEVCEVREVEEIVVDVEEEDVVTEEEVTITKRQELPRNMVYELF